MEPRALLQQAFIDARASDCVARVFDEAWQRFGHMADRWNAETIRLAKASVAYIVLINATAHGTRDMERLKAVVFGWLQKRTHRAF